MKHKPKDKNEYRAEHNVKRCFFRKFFGDAHDSDGSKSEQIIQNKRKRR